MTKVEITEKLTGVFREAGLTVGVIAVDPSSPYTGGAILGDRIRMRDLAGDPGVFKVTIKPDGMGGIITELFVNDPDGVQPFKSSDPDSEHIWWQDAGVHQNPTFGVQPDPVSGMHQPIQDAVGHRWVADLRMPLRRRQLAGQHDDHRDRRVGRHLLRRLGHLPCRPAPTAPGP